MTFDQVMELTRTVSSHTAFEDAECRAYYELLMGLPHGATVVEIGLQFGRSSSIVMQESLEKHFDYHGVDPFVDPPNARDEWMALAQRLGVPVKIYLMESEWMDSW